MKYLVFASETDAQEALIQVNSNMGLPKPGVNAKTGLVEPGAGVTVSWALIQERLDACWCFKKPDDEYMEGVGGFEIETYSDDWFQQTP
jgi:hypothetical protein